MSSLSDRQDSPRWPAEPKRRGWSWLLIGAGAFLIAFWTLVGLTLRGVIA